MEKEISEGYLNCFHYEYLAIKEKGMKWEMVSLKVNNNRNSSMKSVQKQGQAIKDTCF